MIVKLTLPTLLLGALATALPAQAAPFASARAFFDLSSLSSATTGTATFTLTGDAFHYGSVLTSAAGFTDTIDPGDLATPAGADQSAASLMSDPGFIDARASAAREGAAEAYASVALGFTVDGTGAVTLDVDFLIEAELSGTGSADAYAFADALLDVVLFGPDESFTDNATFDFVNAGGNQSGAQTGRLSVTFDVDGFDDGEVVLAGTAEAVPAPATLPLALLGLAVTGWLRGRGRASDGLRW